MLHRTPFFLPVLYPGLLWRMPAEKRELYLTFDDGPVPGPTEFVLEELTKRNVKATFFCIGDNVNKHTSVFKQIVEKGHTIGNHTFNHLKGWNVSTAHYLENTEQCDRTIIENCQLPIVNYFRPPYGRITRTQIRGIKNKKIVMWDVLTRDYDASLTTEKCLRASLAAVRNGSIIVFHDSVKAERNLRFVLPRFLDECRERGYIFKPL